jgi:MFS family permease
MDYPDRGTRAAYLAIIVVGTVVLYYELCIAGAVSPLIIAGYGMTFPFYAYIVLAASVVGALGSLAAGLADRWGRANLIAYGLLATGALTLFGIPATSGKWEFAVVFAIIGYIEGVILVATPALVRDFAQQLGRGSAMGIWGLGPVLGGLVVAVVSSTTLGHLHAWKDQFVICGLVGLAVGLIAVAFLRELSPDVREHIRAAMEDQALIEARASGIDLDATRRRPWREVLRPDVVGPAFGISVFLLIYYTTVAFFTLYFTTVRGFSIESANTLGEWFWAFSAAALIIVGIVCDMLRVRKPFMLVGAIGSIAMTIVFGTLPAGTGYATFAMVISVLGAFLAMTFVPWLAAFTETVERHSPDLTAAGLAVWGWLIRAVIALAMLAIPLIVHTMTIPVVHGFGPGGTGTGGTGAAAAGQWRTWLWVCVGGEVVFVPFIFVMAGRWSPKKAREEAEAHETLVEHELDALREQ